MRKEGAATTTRAAFRLGHGGAVREMIPAQAPYEGGKPTIRKGSYSEEWVKIVVVTQVSEHIEVALSR